MPEEIQDANIAAPSPAQDAEVVSSPTEPAEAPAQQAVQEVPFHQHPRWQEVQDKLHRLEQENMSLRQTVNQPKPQVEVEEDYSGMDPQTRVFYEELDKRVEKKSKKQVDQLVTQMRPVIETLMTENAKLQAKLFRDEQKDVAPNSPEEKEIAKLVSMGLDPDKAAWAVMGPKRVQTAQVKAQDKKVTTTQVKQQANLETSSVPKNSGLPPAKKSFRAELERGWAEIAS